MTKRGEARRNGQKIGFRAKKELAVYYMEGYRRGLRAGWARGAIIGLIIGSSVASLVWWLL